MQNTFNPEHGEITVQLAEVAHKRGLKGVGFDLDDTLIPTEKHIIERLHKFRTAACEKFGLDPEEFWTKFREIDHKHINIYGVNRIVWQHTLTEFGREYGDEKMFNPYLASINSYYEVSPELHEGALEHLELFKSAGLKMGLNTHGNVDWKNFQIETLGIEPYLDVIVIADENRQKGDFDWRALSHFMELDPARLLVVGDNPVRDIWAGFEAGARHGILLPNPARNNEDEALPPGAIYVAGGIKDVAQTMIDYWG